METLHGYNGFYTVQTVFSFPYKEKGYKHTYNIVFFKYNLICKKKKKHLLVYWDLSALQTLYVYLITFSRSFFWKYILKM